MPSFLISFPNPTDNIENVVVDRSSGENFIRQLLMIFDRIDCEGDTEIFINLKNKNQFIDDYKSLEHLLSLRIGAYTLEDTINQYIQTNTIKFLPEDVHDIDYHFTILNTFSQIDSTFEVINQGRIINKTDFRHCENHPARIHSKSPLIGGAGGFDNAGDTLKTAIGDIKSNKKFLINIDSKNQNFIIRFEDENFNNQYHAYHIVKNNNGRYINDDRQLNLLLNPNYGIPRAYKLITYRDLYNR